MDEPDRETLHRIADAIPAENWDRAAEAMMDLVPLADEPVSEEEAAAIEEADAAYADGSWRDYPTLDEVRDGPHDVEIIGGGLVSASQRGGIVVKEGRGGPEDSAETSGRWSPRAPERDPSREQ